MKRLFSGLGMGIFLGIAAVGLVAASGTGYLNMAGYAPALVKVHNYGGDKIGGYRYGCQMVDVRTPGRQFVIVRGTSTGGYIRGGALFVVERSDNVQMVSSESIWGSTMWSVPSGNADNKDAARACTEAANERTLVADITLPPPLH